jgi:hypothetical protein
LRANDHLRKEEEEEEDDFCHPLVGFVRVAQSDVFRVSAKTFLFVRTFLFSTHLHHFGLF